MRSLSCKAARIAFTVAIAVKNVLGYPYIRATLSITALIAHVVKDMRDLSDVIAPDYIAAVIASMRKAMAYLSCPATALVVTIRVAFICENVLHTHASTPAVARGKKDG